MRLLQIIPFLMLASFTTCLLPAPSPKERVRAVEFGESVPGGDIRQRLEASLHLLKSSYNSSDLFSDADPARSLAGKAGHMLLGAVVLSRAAQEDRTFADKIYKTIGSHFSAAGYYGNIPSGPSNEPELAGHGILLRALCEYYLWTGESGALDLAETVCDSLFVPMLDFTGSYPLDSAGRALPDTTWMWTAADTGWHLSYDPPGELFRAAEGLAQLYSLRKSENVGKATEELISLYKEADSDPRGLSAAAYLAGAKAMLRYGEALGTNEYTGEAEKAWDNFVSLSINEFYGAGPVMGDTVVYYCPEVASEAYITAMWLWSITGKGEYLENAEKIFYNGLLSAQAPRGNFTGIMTADTTGKLYRCEDDSCVCNVLWVEALARAARFSYFVRDNKVLMPFYSAGELVMPQKGLHIIQTTDYPLGRALRIEIAEAPKRGIGLHIYFPSYMTMKSMTLNSSMTISGTVNSVGLLEFRDIFRKGDVIDIIFSFPTKWSDADGKGVRGKDIFKASHGPLVLGYESDMELWLERGVTLREEGEYDYMLDNELSYRRDTVTGTVEVLTVMSGSDVSGTEYYEPPILRPLYRPFSAGMHDVFPEYVLVRIGKD